MNDGSAISDRLSQNPSSPTAITSTGTNSSSSSSSSICISEEGSGSVVRLSKRHLGKNKLSGGGTILKLLWPRKFTCVRACIRACMHACVMKWAYSRVFVSGLDSHKKGHHKWYIIYYYKQYDKIRETNPAVCIFFIYFLFASFLWVPFNKEGFKPAQDSLSPQLTHLWKGEALRKMASTSSGAAWATAATVW